MTITHAVATTTVDETDVERAMTFADAALGVAGHEVTAPVLRGIVRSSARGEITPEEAIKRGLAYIDGR